MINTITDLEAYYDRQLPNLISIIEELIGIDRNTIKLITKVLPIMKHSVCTSFGVSKESYMSIEDLITGTRQGNITSGDGCRDQSYYILQEVVIIGLGAVIAILNNS